MEHDGLPIAKLVFLREKSGGRMGRKAVVPLLEGADFEQFLARVRSRLGLQESQLICLREEDMQEVDSIERLLEVDESVTLTLEFEPAEQCSASTAATSAARRPSVAKSAVADVASASCRVDIAAMAEPPQSRVAAVESEGIETGELKYRKKRFLATGFSRLTRLRRYIVPLTVVLGLATIYLMLAS
mmetsp:Transcript_20204/g.39253  ORF Transcript_20204/g.39253 Transcript_20204/m.39253 type:complete len:187 (-) Transcript_20204:659-1219(-)